MVNIFDIDELRNIIFNFIYPKYIKKGMTVKIIKSKFHPFLIGRTEIVYSIKKYNECFIITLLNQSKQSDIFWFTSETYLHANDDNILKVLKC